MSDKRDWDYDMLPDVADVLPVSPAPVGDGEKWINQMEDNELPETLLRKWARLIGRHEPFATAKFCAEDLKRAADRIDVLLDKEEHYRGLIKSVLRNEPSDMAADGVTVLEVWRKDAAALLKE